MKHKIFALSRMLLLSVCLIGTMQAQEFFIPPFTSEPVEFRTAGQQTDYWHPLLKVVEAHAKNRGQKAPSSSLILPANGTMRTSAAKGTASPSMAHQSLRKTATAMATCAAAQ